MSSRDEDRDVIANISSRLLTNKGTPYLIDACATVINDSAIPCDPLELPIPPAYPKNQGQFTQFTFGVSTTFARLRDSKLSFAHWLSNSGSTLIGLLTDDLQELAQWDPTSLEEEYEAEGMNLFSS